MPGNSTGLVQVRFKPMGDCALCAQVGRTPGTALSGAIRALCLHLERAGLPGLAECAPTYTGLTVHYQPGPIRYEDLCAELHQRFRPAGAVPAPNPRVFELPVCYGGAFGPDAGFVAQHHGLTAEQVIELHSRPEYVVGMMGFTPGFPYLLGLPDGLVTPRLPTPRLSVPAGSVAVALVRLGKTRAIMPLPPAPRCPQAVRSRPGCRPWSGRSDRAAAEARRPC